MDFDDEPTVEEDVLRLELAYVRARADYLQLQFEVIDEKRRRRAEAMADLRAKVLHIRDARSGF